MEKPVGPYSPVVKVDGWVIISGQVGIDEGKLVDGGLVPQLHQLFINLKRLLKSQNLSLNDVVKTTVFLTDIEDYAEMNQIYVQEFGNHRPARSAVAVNALPIGAVVEIEAWAKI
ncbi:MAG: deaminase [Acidimicrobiaceae bacterium]|nr:deaminase [Acidimicrobiaceae bacterium]|tara:strand:- start:384 stop:728 length:345 start_codon:yes stop_codon:yes gene_type:complete